MCWTLIFTRLLLDGSKLQPLWCDNFINQVSNLHFSKFRCSIFTAKILSFFLFTFFFFFFFLVAVYFKLNNGKVVYTYFCPGRKIHLSYRQGMDREIWVTGPLNWVKTLGKPPNFTSFIVPQVGFSCQYKELQS